MTTLMEISDTASRATASLQCARKPPGRPQASRATASLQGDRKPPGRPQGIAPTIHGLAKLIRCIVGAIPCGRPLWAAHLISIRTVIGQQSLSLVGFLKRA